VVQVIKYVFVSVREDREGTSACLSAHSIPQRVSALCATEKKQLTVSRLSSPQLKNRRSGREKRMFWWREERRLERGSRKKRACEREKKTVSERDSK
jgi:hypothetical protein